MARVLVLGASDNPERYSYKAIQMLLEAGHTPIPLHPTLKEIVGIKCYHQLADCPPVDTITVYINPQRSDEIRHALIAFPARRFIFNPGSENAGLMQELKEEGVHVVEACTLVLLRTNQFDMA